MAAKFVGACLLAVTLCAGSVSADPLRVLVYRFGYTGAGFNTSAEAVEHGIVNEMTDAGTDGRTGKITVSVQSATQDGGLVVDVSEEIDRAYRRQQTIRCAVYGRTIDVICDQSLTPSAEETVLLSYLGRFFYDPSKLDENQHWQAVPSLRTVTKITNDFSITQTNGDLITMAVAKQIRNGGYKSTSSGTLVYDSALQIPRSVHLSTAVEGSSNYGNSIVDLTLVSDSMAHKGG